MTTQSSEQIISELLQGEYISTIIAEDLRERVANGADPLTVMDQEGYWQLNGNATRDHFYQEMNARLNEPPKRKPYVNTIGKYGRNERCPCGSELKVKRCCWDAYQRVLSKQRVENGDG